MNIIEFFLVMHTLFVISLTLRILARDNLTPITRLAWFIVITIFPYVGVIIYLLLGEVKLGFHADQRHDAAFKKLREHVPHIFGDIQNTSSAIEPEYQAAFAYANSVNGFNTCLGNTAKLMPDATTARASMLKDFDNAQKSIDVLYYIWLNDETGTNVAQALIRAAERGVKVRAMADGLGSRAILNSELWQAMRRAGIETQTALPIGNIIKTMAFSRLDLRNHRKITQIDGLITYCGSQNCADPEFYLKSKYAPWVDIMLRLEGPIVAQNQALFASDWLMHNASTPLDSFDFNAQAIPTGFPAQVFGDGPTERKRATPQLFATLLSQAQEELFISTPYFVPDFTLLNALCSAAYRGVEVTLIFPQRNDSFIVAAASRSYYRQLLEAGITIYEFKPGLLHAKTLTIDGKVSLIGSTNLDLRSFDLNYENNILLRDDATTQAIRERQQDYIKDSEIIGLDTVLLWPLHKRLWNNVIATIGPVL